MGDTLRKLWLIGLIGLLAACAASDARYPSLALRPFETAPAAAIAVPEGSALIRPVASSAEIVALRDKAMVAHDAFIRQQPATEQLVRAATGQPIESNARARALVAMADLSTQRGVTSTVLADLDGLAAEAATTFAPIAEINAARAQVLPLIESENAVIERLWETMGS